VLLFSDFGFRVQVPIHAPSSWRQKGASVLGLGFRV
jgi:hypothetical protein